jgi:peptide deformylase
VDLRGVDAEFDWRLDGAKPPLELFMPMVVVNPKLTVARKTPTAPLGGGMPLVSRDPRRRRAGRGRLGQVQDQGGLPHTLECTGLFARCMLHEVDHLNGILFIDRMEKEVRDAIKDALKALARETRLGKDPTTA